MENATLVCQHTPMIAESNHTSIICRKVTTLIRKCRKHTMKIRNTSLMRYLKNIQGGCLIQLKRYGFINSIVTKMGTIRPVVVGDRVFGVVVVMDRDINYLLKKYEKPFVKGECISKERRLQIYHEQKDTERNELIKSIGDEFYLSNDEKTQVQYIISQLDNISRLHSKLNEDIIIAAICFDVKRHYANRTVKLEDYSASTKYELDTQKLYIIISNLLHYLRKHKSFIKPIETTKYDNEILSRQGIDKFPAYEIDSILKY